jgi:hypothetical protein
LPYLPISMPGSLRSKIAASNIIGHDHFWRAFSAAAPLLPDEGMEGESRTDP